jgi:hypothetical protein
MTNLARHLLSQRRVFMALGQVAIDALLARREGSVSPVAVPGPEVRVRVNAPGQALISDYVSSVGGARHVYAGKIPAHLFPHWSFPPLVESLRSARYPLARALNVGCRLQMNAALSAAHELDIRAQLVGVRDDGRRAVLHARVTTGQSPREDALVADLYAIVPSRTRASSEQRAATREREIPLIPAGARALRRIALRRRAGLSFALLTGDVNPIHWLAPYARAAGFSGPILHGFALLAQSIEALIHTCCQGHPERLGSVDVRFTRPLPLPAEVSIFADHDRFFVGDGPETAAYMTGTFSVR